MGPEIESGDPGRQMGFHIASALKHAPFSVADGLAPYVSKPVSSDNL